MHYGFRIIEDLCDGLSNWMDEKGFASIEQVTGRSLHHISEFRDFDLSFKAVARIDPQKCIKCNLCWVACNDTAHQCIDLIDAAGNAVAPQSYACFDRTEDWKLSRHAAAATCPRRRLCRLPPLL